MLKNLVATVTGAASGIGKATVEEFCKQGVRAIVLADINRAKLDSVTLEFSKQYPNVELFPMKVDVSQSDHCQGKFRIFIKLKFQSNGWKCSEKLWTIGYCIQ